MSYCLIITVIAPRIKCLTRKEIEAKAGSSLLSHYNTTDSEYYFLGFELKDWVAAQNRFIQPDVYASGEKNKRRLAGKRDFGGFVRRWLQKRCGKNTTLIYLNFDVNQNDETSGGKAHRLGRDTEAGDFDGKKDLVRL